MYIQSVHLAFTEEYKEIVPFASKLPLTNSVTICEISITFGTLFYARMSQKRCFIVFRPGPSHAKIDP